MVLMPASCSSSREHSIPTAAVTPEQLLDSYKVTIEQADKFLNLLHKFCDLGTAMRSVITRCLAIVANAPQYQVLNQIDDDLEYANFMRRSAEKYSEALHSLTKPEPPLEFQDCPDCTSMCSLRSWSASCSTCCQTPSTRRHLPASLSFTTLECP